MCTECNKQFCPSSCPDAPTPNPPCKKCGAEGAYRGATGQVLCVDCISEMSLAELLRFCGLDRSIKFVMLMAALPTKVEKLERRNWRALFRG